MPFNVKKPSLVELDDRMVAVEDAVLEYESTEHIQPEAGTAPGKVRWKFLPRTFIEASVEEAGALVVIGGIALNVTSVVIPAERSARINGVVAYKLLNGTPGMIYAGGGASGVSSTLPTPPDYASHILGSTVLSVLHVFAIPERIVTAGSSATTIYLVARANWAGGGSVGVFGRIRAELLP
jgi:hypothetical protein